MKRLALIVFVLAVTACGGDNNPTAPTPPATPTRIIDVSGGLNFGETDISTTKNLTMTVRNNGNSPLVVTGMQITTGDSGSFTASPLTFTVAASSSQAVTINFHPTQLRDYVGVISVTSNATSGPNTLAYAGRGTTTAPPFVRSGTGNNVFDLPPSVGRVRIQASPTTSCQNFAVRRNGSLLVNTIIGTCSVADSRTYDGTHLVTGGGTIEIIISEGVNWTFTEVR